MKKHIYDNKTDKLIKVVEAIPQCSDYCDSCGDCLACDGESACCHSADGKHFWVVYVDREEEDG